MKSIVIVTLLIVLMCSTAWADAFQFVNRSNGALAIEAPVYLKSQLVGYTNGQGILFVNAPRGNNTYTLSFMGKKYSVQLNISGNATIQIIYID